MVYGVLKLAGILMVIVPLSFMQNKFLEKTCVANINSDFSFVEQPRMNHSGLSSTGVQNFAIKAMVFLLQRVVDGRASVELDNFPTFSFVFIS